MYSYNHFTPGARKNTSRIIKYVADRNGMGENTCFCIPNQYNKNVPGSNSPSIKVSNAVRISHIVRGSKGGRVQYGNSYLGQEQYLNYLGKTAGMPGGSGMPPINKFN